MLKIAVFEGDGIGPEICGVARSVLNWVQSRCPTPVAVQSYPCGLESLRSSGTTLPQASFQAAQSADGIVLAPLSTLDYPEAASGGVNVSSCFRNAFELGANIRPARSYPGLSESAGELDVVIVRENTEGFYAVRGMYAGSGEFCPDPDTAFALRKITRAASERVARQAFDIARRRDRRSVTAVHKANVLKLSDGLFLDCCRAVAEAYPDVEYAEEIVDAAAAKLVRPDAPFDVIVTTNLFGDILSNEAAELCGGLGIAGSLNVGPRSAMAQAVHGSAPQIAGRDVANPISLVLSVAMLLRWLGLRHEAPDLVEAAVRIETCARKTLSDQQTRTQDVAGLASTNQVEEALLAALRDPAVDGPFPSALRPSTRAEEHAG